MMSASALLYCLSREREIILSAIYILSNSSPLQDRELFLPAKAEKEEFRVKERCISNALFLILLTK